MKKLANSFFLYGYTKARLILESKHVAKYLPDTNQMQQILEKEGSAHVFNDEATMFRVTQAIMETGEFTGVVRGHERYGLFFVEPIGYRISIDGSRIPLSLHRNEGERKQVSCHSPYKA